MTAGDFYEEDEDPAAVAAAFDRAPKGLTAERMFSGAPVTLSAKRITVALGVGSYTSSSIRLEHDAQTAMHKLTTYVLTRKLAGDQQLLEVRHPATWWQHLKLSLPGWVTRRWPVRWTTARAKTSFAKYDTYPGADIMPKELGVPVQFDAVSFDPIDYDGPFGAVTRSTTVNAGREFLTRQRLLAELSHLVDMRLSASARDWHENKGFPPRQVTQEVLAVLERLGVNPGQLVQQYAIDEAHRTW